MHFFLSSDRVNTDVWMHYMNANETYGKKSLATTQAILNKSWGQHPTKQQLYGHLTPPSRKLSKLDGPDMRDNAGEVVMNS